MLVVVVSASEEELECRICLAPLAESPVEGLNCAHVFHAECITRYMRVKGASREDACPFKCRISDSEASKRVAELLSDGTTEIRDV